MGHWIRVFDRPRCQKFRCPHCLREVSYIDSFYKLRPLKKSECCYKYCPWCREEVSHQTLFNTFDLDENGEIKGQMSFEVEENK